MVSRELKCCAVGDSCKSLLLTASFCDGTGITFQGWYSNSDVSLNFGTDSTSDASEEMAFSLNAHN